MIIGLASNPQVGAAGEKAILTPLGAKTRSSNVMRYYLEAAPAASELVTLNTLSAKQTRADAALTPTKAGQGTFTPDVTGKYEIRWYDVEETRNEKHYAGQQFTTGPTDNELTTAPNGLFEYWVAEVNSREIGTAPDSATLTVRNYDYTVEQALSDSVVLTPASTSLAEVAANDADVQNVLADIRAVASAGLDRIPFEWSRVVSTIEGFNRHVAFAVDWKVHNTADAVNGLVSSTVPNLAAAIAVLNDLKAKYNLHFQDAVAHDNTYGPSVSAPDATDYASAVTLWEDIHLSFVMEHMTDALGHAHTGVPVANPVDGVGGTFVESPQTESELLALSEWVAGLYEAHRAKELIGPAHGFTNPENVVAIDISTTASLIKTVNAWADALVAHANNVNVDGSTPGGVYHTVSSTGSALQISQRASSLSQAAALAEVCLVAYMDHATDTNYHAVASYGAHGLKSIWPLTARLTRAWLEAVGKPTATIPLNHNPMSSSLVTSYGWT